jgi:putative ABC transport system permease protein
METLLHDLGYGFRMLRKSPGFTAVAVLTLALGVGANTAIFSVVNAVLLHPLPFGEPERVVAVFETNFSRGFFQETLSPANFLDLSQQNQVFSAVAAYLRGPMALTGRGEATKVRAVTASPSLFAVLGITPFIGRGFITGDGQAGHDHVVVLSHQLWTTRFGADAGIIGKMARLDGEDYVVVGVMPAEFQFPLSGSDVWVPLHFKDSLWAQRGAHFLSGVARLKPGVSLAKATADLETIGARLAAEYQRTNKGFSFGALEFRNALVGDVKPALLILLASVVLVVLIACANIANLLLARASERDREVAIRTALGATPFRLGRQLLTESLLLSTLGAAAGLILAAWGIKIILLYGPRDIPRIQGVHIDGSVLAFSAVLAGITGVIFGIFPALRAARPDLNQSLKSGTRTTGDREGRWLRSSLVASELALSLVLLAGAGLLLRSFLQLQSVDPGFNPVDVLTFDLSLPQVGYPNGGRVAAFSNDLLQRLQALPGVESAAVVNPRPLSGDDYSSSFTIKGQLSAPGDDDRSAQVRIVSRDYFRTLQIPLLRGRLFQTTDRRDAPPVVVLSRNAEKNFFPRVDALGQQMNFGARIGYDKVGGEIVGIVGDVHDFGLDVAPPPDAYVLQDQAGVGEMSLLVRTEGDPTTLAAAVREQVHAVDNNLPVAAMSTMEVAMGESLAQRRFYMLLLGLFAAIAISLAAVGVYGVMSYSVGRRTQEIGIRLALGARHQQVLKLVMTQAARLVAAGLIVGLVVAAASGRALAGLLFGISASDPLILGGVSATLAVVAMLAGYLPARRVLKVDPLVALRDE